MDSTELARGSGLQRPDDVAVGAAAAPAATERDEHSGLHEIKALASTTRKRISKKASSETEAEESLLIGASSGSFRAAALPDPARQRPPASEPLTEGQAVRAPSAVDRPFARPASEVDRRPLPARPSSAPFWILGGVAATAAAAAVAVFVFGVGREKDKTDEETATLARSDEAASPAPGMVAPSAEPQFAQPPPAAPAPTGGAATASAPAVIALGEAGGARSDDEDDRGAKGTEKVESKASASDKGDGAEDRKAVREGEKEQKKKNDPVYKEGKDLNDVLDQVTGGVDAPKQVEEEGPKKPSKKGLDRADVSKAMGAVRGAAMRCRDLEQFEGSITVKFTVAPSGQVASAEATGGKKGTPTGDCVAAAVKRARFPAFDGVTTSFTFPFLLAE